jgi:hypothetical protein
MTRIMRGAMPCPHRVTGLLPVLLSLLLAPSMQAQLDQPESVVFDARYNRYLVSNWGNGNIVEIDSLGVMTPINTDLTHVAGLHIVGDTLYAASNYGPLSGLVGIDLASGDLAFRRTIPGMQLLNDITSDRSGHLYVTEYYGNKVFKVRISDLESWVFVDSGLTLPNGILYDELEDRLLVLSEGGSGAPIMAISLQDSSLSLVVATNTASTDGLAEDNQHRIYFSSWATNRVYRYDRTFANPPEVVSSGHAGPADIYFNKHHDVLAVPNFNRNTVDLIPIASAAVRDAGNPRRLHSFELHQNHPNPFNPHTNISFWLPRAAGLNLTIYDVGGRFVKSLAAGGQWAPGRHTVTWDGTDQRGVVVGAGVYFCTMGCSWHEGGRARATSLTRRMVLVR